MNDPENPATPPVTDDAHEPPSAGPDWDFTDPNSSLARYYVRASHVYATLLVVLVFLFFNLMTPLGHSDVWGHLKIGEWIVQNHRLPEHELFSPYSDTSLPASNFQWLSQVVMYGAFRTGAWLVGGSTLHQLAGGVDMLRGLHALAEAAKTVFLLLAFRRFTGSLPVAIGGIVLVFVFSLAPSAIQRPQAFAEVLFAAILWLMAWPLARRANPDWTSTFVAAGPLSPPIDGAPLSWTRTLVIAGLLALWANVHGSFLLGIALVGVLWFGRTLDSVVSRGLSATIHDGPLHRPLLAAGIGVVLLSLLNPDGVRAIPNVLAFSKSPNVLTMQEWRPLDFSAGAGGHWGYLALLILVAITQAVSPRVLAPSQLAMLLFFGTVPLLQERLMTWWYMVVPVVILPTWVDLFAPAPIERWTSVLSFRKTVIAALIALIGVVWSSLTQLTMGHPPVPVHLSASQATVWAITPELLAGQEPASADDKAQLEKSPLYKPLKTAIGQFPDGRFRGVIFTPEAMGDYLVWSLPPKAPVMAYSHVHVFPPDYWEDYMEILFGLPGWKAVLDRHRVNLIVSTVERKDLLEKLKDDDGWEVVLDQSDQPSRGGQRLFVAVRKKPL